MNNLFAFIHSIRFLLFFLLLQLIAFLFIINSSGYQQASIVHSANNVSGWFYTKNKNIKDYFNLAEANEALLKENARLKNLNKNYYHKTAKGDSLINDTVYQIQYVHFPAKVIKNSVSTRYNILTLNVGARNGVKREMGVVSSKGVVGFVKDVSYNYCTVMPLMNENFKTTVKSKKENLFGDFSWAKSDAFNTGTVSKVPTYIKLKKGDTMVSTSQEGIFPEGTPVGKVLSINEEPGSNYKTIKLKTSVDFYDLNHVMVIKNIFKNELDSLNAPK